MKPDTNKQRLSTAQHLRLVQRMRSYGNCLENAGIPPAATFRLAMLSGKRILAELQ
ncbi:hypothetical protein PB70LOC_04483 [Pectobacterium versatile]|nr:hypothetical protein PB70LOC_04483 [Pectobacterium versatile]POY60860.1 hypothetical protein PB69LOC_04483 [Pectobacterium versatile]